MCDNILYTEYCGKITAVAKIFNALFAVFLRYKPYRFGTVVKIPDAGTFPAAPEGGYGYFVFNSKLIDNISIFLCEKCRLPAYELAVVKTLIFQIFLEFPF